MSRKTFFVTIFVLLLVSLYLLVKPFESVDYRLSKDAKIVVLGDSLTAGYGSTKDNDYVTVLSKMINRPIVNLGMSGDTTSDALKRLNEVIKRDPDLVIVFLGGNDVLQRQNIDTTFSNLDLIVASSTQNGAKVVLVEVPGAVIRDPYKDRFESLAKKYDAILVPQFISKMVGNRELMYDAIHPNDAGYKIVAEEIYKAIKEII